MEKTIKVQSLTNPAPKGQRNSYDGYTEGTELVVWHVAYNWNKPDREEDFLGISDLKDYDLTTTEGRDRLQADYHLQAEGFYSCLQGIGEGGNGFETDTFGPFEYKETAESEAREFFQAE